MGDVFLIETMSSVEEALAAVQAVQSVRASHQEVWVSWTLSEERHGCIRSGESVEAALSSVKDLVSTVLFNCCSIPAMRHAVPRVLSKIQTEGLLVKLGLYPNAFIPKGDLYEDKH